MSSTRKTTVRAAALVAIGSLALGACSGGGGDGGGGGTPSEDSTGSAEAVEGGSAVFAVDSPFLGFDPNITPAAQDARVLRQVYDSLLYLDENRDLQPWLATEWEVSDDGLTYTFTLRDDVTFHDDTPFNGEAVCFNLDRIKAPETASIYAIGLIGPDASCEAPDETTAVVTLATPYAPFLNNLTSPFMGINSPTAAAAAAPADYTLAPTGSGPFEIASYTAGDRVELVRNEDYTWGLGNAEHTGAAYLEALTFQIIPDATVRMGSVRNGTVQAGSNVPETEVAAIEADTSLEFIGEPLRVFDGVRGSTLEDRVAELMRSVGLDPSRAEARPRALSGGQRQRVGIARAISLNPKLILADEAVSALDVSVQAQITNLLMDLRDRLGPTYLFISHGLPIVRQVAQRVGVMYLGRLMEIGNVDEVFENPQHPYTRALMAASPVPDPTMRRERVVLRGEPPTALNLPSGCRFRTRCPMAQEICALVAPPLIQLGNGHAAECHFAGHLGAVS
ncbi:MAG: ATP-binding cassette domain-containing protein [Actinomycetales bacterium]|nr:ATP-binding cassette domain-containing protein [Actinomycetales bacterium]